jgi:hypothetical protein
MANPKSYSYAENLYAYSTTFDSNGWSRTGAVVTANATSAPDGTNTAYLIQEDTSVNNSHWLNLAFTSVANTTYTTSCYYKPYSNDRQFFFQTYDAGAGGTGYAQMGTSNDGTTIAFSSTSGGYSNGTFSITPVSNGWYRAAFTWQTSSILQVSTRIGMYNNGAQYWTGNGTSGIYVWGPQIQRNNQLKNYVPNPGSTPLYSSTTFKDMISNYSPTISGDGYYNYNANGTMQFTRTTAPNLKYGGGISGSTTGNLRVNNFLYNDHTWEVWVRIDDPNPGIYDATESFSIISAFDGYHQGWLYYNTYIFYALTDYDGTTTYTYTAGNYNFGSQVLVGNWYQLTAVKNGMKVTTYLNGVYNAGLTMTNYRWNNLYTSGILCISKIYNAAPGAGSYMCYGKNTFSHMRMYNRALTAEEVAQNFSANRGRFGL